MVWQTGQMSTQRCLKKQYIKPVIPETFSFRFPDSFFKMCDLLNDSIDPNLQISTGIQDPFRVNTTSYYNVIPKFSHPRSVRPFCYAIKARNAPGHQFIWIFTYRQTATSVRLVEPFFVWPPTAWTVKTARQTAPIHVKCGLPKRTRQAELNMDGGLKRPRMNMLPKAHNLSTEKSTCLHNTSLHAAFYWTLEERVQAHNRIDVDIICKAIAYIVWVDSRQTFS